MRPISIREASRMMQAPEEFVREAIRQNKIQGAFYMKKDEKSRGVFYITDEQVTNMMKGVVKDEG